MDQTRITPKKLSWTSIQEMLESDHKKSTLFAQFKSVLSTDKPGEFQTLLISDMADEIWEAIKNDNDSEIGSTEQINAVIGWSTGALAAYEMVYNKKKDIKAAVLIAPGTNIKLVTEITTATLNGNTEFEHLDGIRPDSPLKVPQFAINLLVSGLASQKWKVDHDVKGLVLLSDPQKDNYVDSEKVESTLKRNAPDFERVNYSGAAHEIDNESDEHRTDGEGVKLEVRVVQFLDDVFT